MTNLSFVLWLLGWPLLVSLLKYLEIHTYGKAKPFSTFESLLYLIVWVTVAALLYVP